MMLSGAAAAFGLGTTILTVHLAGAPAFAFLVIDLAKLSLAAVVLELAPSAYTVVQAQRDPDLMEDLAALVAPAAAAMVAIILVLGGVGLFTHFSFWMIGYAVYLVLQQYFGVKLQAQGRMREFFEQTFTAAALRLVLLVTGLVAWPRTPVSDILWGALSAGALLSTAFWLARHPAELAPFFRTGHGASLGRLWRLRRAFYPYYLNTALKRVRDNTVPILCGALVADVHQIARYLLAYRGVDFVCGQLRIAETALNHLATRLELAPSRRRDFTLLSILAQGAAFAASGLMAMQTGLDRDVLLLAFAASFFVYPYVVELISRSDAYVDQQPRRVTISLLAFTLGAAGVVLTLVATGRGIAPLIILAPLVGQTLASLTYLFTRPRQAAAETSER